MEGWLKVFDTACGELGHFATGGTGQGGGWRLVTPALTQYLLSQAGGTEDMVALEQLGLTVSVQADRTLCVLFKLLQYTLSHLLAIYYFLYSSLTTAL